jgi:hypothetical protein
VAPEGVVTVERAAADPWMFAGDPPTISTTTRRSMTQRAQCRFWWGWSEAMDSSAEVAFLCATATIQDGTAVRVDDDCDALASEP